MSDSSRAGRQQSATISGNNKAGGKDAPTIFSSFSSVALRSSVVKCQYTVQARRAWLRVQNVHFSQSLFVHVSGVSLQRASTRAS